MHKKLLFALVAISLVAAGCAFAGGAKPRPTPQPKPAPFIVYVGAVVLYTAPGNISNTPLPMIVTQVLDAEVNGTVFRPDSPAYPFLLVYSVRQGKYGEVGTWRPLEVPTK